MAKQMVLLENMSNVSQNVTDDDLVVHSIPPLGRFPYPEAIANKFLTERGRYVRIYTPTAIPPPNAVNEPMEWIANVTGNPDTPPKIKLTETHRGEPKVVEYEHLCHKARVLEYKMNRGQQRDIDNSGLPFHKNLGTYLIRLQPYERALVPKHVADFVKTRASMIGSELGTVVTSVRAPSPWEPNVTWTLGDMWLYATLFDSSKFTPAFEKQLAQVADPSAKSVKQIIEKFPGLVNEVKQELWKHLFFRLCNDEYPLVNEAVFNAKKAAGTTILPDGTKVQKKSASEELVDSL